MVQELSFGNETEILKSNARSNVTKSSNILCLDVFVETSSDRHNHSLEPQKGWTWWEKIYYQLSKELWILINANSACRSVTFKCVICWRLRGKLGVRKLADLPKHKTEVAPPFTYCGLVMFGAFLIRERRTGLKRYETIHKPQLYIFTFLTETFIQVLRRFTTQKN